MKRYIIGIVLVAAVGIFNSTAQAAVVDIECDFTALYRDPDNVQYMWGFDYELQQLTIMESLFDSQELYPYTIDVRGSADSDDTTFHVTRIITNNTGVAWTGYELSNAHDEAEAKEAARECNEGIADNVEAFWE